MNSFRSRPMPLGRALAAAQARWATATTSAFQPWNFAQHISSSPSSLFSTSPNPLSALPSPPNPSTTSKNRVPSPIPLVPDVATFLSVIGRNMKQHTAKFPSWEALFTLTSQQLRELGIDPPRDRRYLLRWVQRFRDGRFGIAGDFQFVHNGVAELRVRETVDPEDPLVVRKVVLNVPVSPEGGAAGEGEDTAPAEGAAGTVPDYDLNAPPVRVHGYKVVGAKTIAGPYALPLKQQAGSRVAVTEGMWEDKRGHKIDGGERRQAEVRFRRRAAERRAARESFGN
ncbi:telomere length regulation protein [Sporothrix curviconia]|uniref:Small ribosomal subunit protein mS41 n=1 Tax=Sporothrix curviconia TaxID=1260050 RepID=A0ABP0C9M4_9PEZI